MTTIKSKRYVKRRPEELEVIRLTEENIAEVAQLISRPMVHGKWISVGRGDTAKAGDYLCRNWGKSNSTEGWFSFSPDAFEDIYQEAK